MDLMGQTEELWPSSVASGAPVAPSQSLTVPSSEHDASRLPSGEKAMDLIDELWLSHLKGRACMGQFR